MVAKRSSGPSKSKRSWRIRLGMPKTGPSNLNSSLQPFVPVKAVSVLPNDGPARDLIQEDATMTVTTIAIATGTGVTIREDIGEPSNEGNIATSNS